MKKDIIIISGLAKGIDSKAHQTCINSGGKTTAKILKRKMKNLLNMY